MISWARLSAHIRSPLYGNGYALLLSGLASAGLGMVYWLLAARFYPAEFVGLNSAAISAMLLLSGLAQLSLNSALVRFLPRAGRAAGALVGYAYLSSGLAGALIGLIFIAQLERWAPALQAFFVPPGMLFIFVLSVLVWSVFALQDSVLTGLSQTIWVPLENLLVAFAKIVLLLIFARSFQQYGLFAAWMLPVAAAILPVNLFLVRRVLPNHSQLSEAEGEQLGLRQIVPYLANNYLGTIFFLAYSTLLPLLVTSMAGARANAYFYMPWMIATALQLVALNLTTSLMVEATRDRKRLGVYCYQVFLHSIRLLVPLVILILVAAPLVLRIYGLDYAQEGAGLLRLLALSTLPNIIVALYLALIRVQNQVRGVTLVQGALSILLLGMSYLLLPIYGISGVGLAALASQSCVAVALLFTELPAYLQRGRTIYLQERAALRRHR